MVVGDKLEEEKRVFNKKGNWKKEKMLKGPWITKTPLKNGLEFCRNEILHFIVEKGCLMTVFYP